MAYTYPVLTNSAIHTQNMGVMHMPTQFKIGGTSLHPLQRTGAVSNATFPVMAPRGARQIGGNSYAAQSNVSAPPIVAYAGGHTRMPGHMV